MDKVKKNLVWLVLVINLFNPHLVQAKSPIFHPLEGRTHCLMCHQTGVGSAIKIPPDEHIEWTNDMCLSCHIRSGGSGMQLYGAFIPFLIIFVYGLYLKFKLFGITFRIIMRRKVR